MPSPASTVAAIAFLGAFSCCCGGLVPDAPDPAPGAPEGETNYVVSATSLKIRANPVTNMDELADAPRGAAVVVTGGSVARSTVDGIGGGWVPVWYQGTTGWAFDGFLLPVPAPPPKCASLRDWAQAIGYAGSETVVSSKTCASLDIGEDGDCETRKRTPLQNGSWFETMGGYEWGEDVLYVRGVERDAFWAAARSCIPRLDLPRRGLPAKSGELASPSGTEIVNFAATAEANRWGWSWEEGCGDYVWVERVGSDMQVTVGGGC